MQALPLADAETIVAHDEVYERTLESLLAADRGLARVLDAVEAEGLTDRTVILFASDNGFLFGEHRLFSKGVPYEESVRVPLVAYNPALTPGTRSALPCAQRMSIASSTSFSAACCALMLGGG